MLTVVNDCFRVRLFEDDSKKSQSQMSPDHHFDRLLPISFHVLHPLAQGLDRDKGDEPISSSQSRRWKLSTTLMS